MSAFTEAAKRNKKPRPRMIDQKKAKNKLIAKDRAENLKVKRRSEGRCEVTRIVMIERGVRIERCTRHAVGEPHHLIYGIGRRNIGKSILSAHKIAVCKQCHAEIHGHVLKPINEADRYDAKTVHYERIE